MSRYPAEINPLPEPQDENVPKPIDMLSWQPAERTIGFRNTWKMYDGTVFSPSKPSSETSFEVHERYGELVETLPSIAEYRKSQNYTGLLVLKDGKLLHEEYNQGNTRQTLWTSRSIAKSMSSILLGVAVKQGYIASVNDSIVKYVPEAKGTAWEDCTLRHIVTHTSGVYWNENYADPQSHFAEMTRLEAGENVFENVLKLILGLEQKHKPGTRWSYCGAGSFMLGLAIENATGVSLGKYMETNLWKTAENQGVWQCFTPGKHDVGAHGFNATLRDYARIGQFCCDDGVMDGEKLVPDNWFQESTKWLELEPTGEYRYGYQWWGPAPTDYKYGKDTYMACGIYGQFMLINPKANAVMVQFSAWKEAKDDHKPPQFLFEEILKKLDESEHKL